MDKMRERVARASFICGNHAVVVEYDPKIGDISPQYSEMAAQNVGVKQQLPSQDAPGEAYQYNSDETINFEHVPRTGDVKIRDVWRRNLILQPGKERFQDCDWVIEIAIQDIAELLVTYPNVSQRAITGEETEGESALFDIFDGDTDDKGEHQVYVYKLYHRGTAFLDSGRYVEFTRNCILRNESMVEAFGHREMPIVDFPCFEVLSYPRSRGMVDKLVMLQVLRNNTFSIMYTNMVLGAQIKWLINRASRVEKADISNVAGIITYSGTVAPALVQFKTIGAELFQMIETIDKAMDRVGAIHDISRGEVPARADSGAMVAQLDELEARRAHSIMQEHDRGLEQIGKLALATAGSFYSADDERTIRIVGKGDQFSVRALDVTKLGGAYDIRVVRGSGLSDSKTGRIGQIKEIAQIVPLPPEQILDLMEMGDDQRYYDLATVAINAAERENELLSEGNVVAEAGLWEEQELHWYSHLKFMQSPSFKEMPQEIKFLFMQHVGGHEMLMLLKMQMSPGYKMKIQTQYPNFPCFTPKEAIMAMTGQQQAGPLQSSPQTDPGVDPTQPPLQQPREIPEQ
jgi:hypothetical protein